MKDCYRRAPGVASRVLDGEAHLVKTPGNLLFVLNGAASRIWVRADGTRSGTDLTGKADRAEAKAFLDEMVELGLLSRSPSPRDRPDAFPQDVKWPACEPTEPTEAPKIRVAEAIEVVGGCDDTGGCDTPFSV
jgi:hypothetical protein